MSAPPLVSHKLPGVTHVTQAGDLCLIDHGILSPQMYYRLIRQEINGVCPFIVSMRPMT